MQQKDDPLYSRGRYRLEWDRKRDGSLRSPFLQIVWYDDAAGRNRSRSTGADSMPDAEDALDRFYLERERGQAVCPTCGKPFESSGSFPVSQSISDYLVARSGKPSIEAMRYRAAHFLDFMDATNRISLTCEQVDEGVIDAFRAWSAEQPVITGTINRKTRKRAPGTTEASVSTVAAAINLSHRRKDAVYPASFRAKGAMDVSQTPQYRADVKTLARMFRYATQKRVKFGDLFPQRVNLLRFLQLSVATWARPDAVHDFSTAPARGQWNSAARVVSLNPKGRVQTKKYRPSVPVPEQMAVLLDQHDGFYVEVANIRKAFEAMLDELGLPRDRETGVKVIRRSIAQIVRKRIGEEHWRQGEIMLGHQKASISDLYALFDPANLGLALAATSAIIDEIIAVVPDAYFRPGTGVAPGLKLIAGGRNG